MSGDNLLDYAPLFALPLEYGSNIKHSPLTYQNIHIADSICSQILTSTAMLFVREQINIQTDLDCFRFLLRRSLFQTPL